VPLRGDDAGRTRAVLRPILLLAAATLSLMMCASGAFAASAGCDLVNSGALDTVATAGSGSQTKSTGSVAFESGEVITETFNRNATTVVTDFALSSSPVINNQSTPSPADGDQLQLTIPSNSSFDLTSRLGEVAPGAPTFASVTVTCLGVTQATTTSLASSLNPSNVGDSVTFTATVTPTGGGTPTGNLIFAVDGVNVNTVALNGSGQATFTTSALATGTHPVTAAYQGDSTFNPSTSPVLTQVVAARPTTTALQSSLNPSQVGDSVTFTATVSPTSGAGTPTGSVIFRIDGADVETVALSGGSATYTTSSLVAGTHPVTAAYQGSTTFDPSTSAVLGQVVGALSPRGTTTGVQSSLNPSKVGNSVTFTVTVSPASGAGTPTGNVVFSIDSANVKTVALSGGKATHTTSSLAAGTHPVTAAYQGSASFDPSASPVLNQVVGAPPKATTTAVQSSLNPSEVGDLVTFTATVDPASGTGTPTGSVVFTIGGINVQTATLSGGKATYSTSALAAGTHPIIAAYQGSGTFTASTSPVLNQSVSAPDNQDSQHLRDMQIMATKVVAQTAGQSIQGAIDSSIDDGFGQGGGPIDMGPQAFRFNFAAEPRTAQSRPAPLDPLAFDKRAQPAGSAESASQAIDASLGQTSQTHAMAASSDGGIGARWRPWVDIRGTGWDTDDEQADIQGGQVNALAGLTYKVSPSFLVGVFGGYENFDYSSDPLDADIDGDGWTGGAYLGWLITKGLRFDAGLAGSAIDYDIAAGTANGSFDATRWLFTSGLTGTQQVGAFIVEPSAKVYILWENEDAYVDSLGTMQGERDFSTGRASGGLKLSYPVAFDGGIRVLPFAGAYADYYFSDDSATILTGFEDSIEDGWAARFTGGFGFTMASGVNATISGEVGGLGGGGAFNYSGRANLIVPF
jgi:outer membrane autotransporter protein